MIPAPPFFPRLQEWPLALWERHPLFLFLPPLILALVIVFWWFTWVPEGRFNFHKIVAHLPRKPSRKSSPVGGFKVAHLMVGDPRLGQGKVYFMGDDYLTFTLTGKDPFPSYSLREGPLPLREKYSPVVRVLLAGILHRHRDYPRWVRGTHLQVAGLSLPPCLCGEEATHFELGKPQEPLFFTCGAHRAPEAEEVTLLPALLGDPTFPLISREALTFNEEEGLELPPLPPLHVAPGGSHKFQWVDPQSFPAGGGDN